MRFLKALFGPKATPRAKDQAVLVYLDGQGLPADIYENHDLTTLEDQLIAAIASGDLGEFDGNEVGGSETTLFMYGANAERLYRGIEPVLRAYPLCKGARVVIRTGAPGAAERELRL